jgi:flagellum-specific peptidoglycan hydrolase FlgJ
MTPKAFVEKFFPFAKQTEAKTGLSAIATLTQAALESAWGNSAPGNMFFGVKDSDGLNGNEQLLLTTEYLDNPNKKFPVTVSIVQIGKKLWKYRIKDWFRKYATPEECFTQHARFFETRPRYAKAWAVRGSHEAFFREIEAAKYATAVDEKTGKPNYADTLVRISKTIIPLIPKNFIPQ